MNSKISVILPNRTELIEYDPSSRLSLKDILSSKGIVLNSPCGGNGVCGKCKVYVDQSLQNACRYYPEGGITVQIPAESLSVLTPDITDISYTDDSTIPGTSSSPANLYAAIDLGSTTISVELLAEEPVATDTFFNPTLSYGSDIISRQQAQMAGRCEEFSKVLTEALTSSLNKLVSRCGYDISRLTHICIAGNTTMQHFLYGVNVTPLASYPFKADVLDFNIPAYSDIFGGIHTIGIPSFSTFIGGDIISGLNYINSASSHDEPFLLLDLGTNAEMVLFHDGKYLCTSAAAGPAFEGTNISCGCAAVPGAIKNVSIRKNSQRETYNVKYETIRNKLPIGICGSGILSLYSQLIKNDVIDEAGMLADPYFETGFSVAKTSSRNLTITQNDIRELQLAIAAIRTGISFLLKKAGLSVSNLKNIYIAGSFGKALDIETIESIALLPGADHSAYERITMVGNSSLNGAKLALLNIPSESASYKDALSRILSSCDEIILANEPDFNEMFLSELSPRRS